MNSRRHAYVLLTVVLGAITLLACGGGGGGGEAVAPADIPYTGITTQAAVDSANAEDLAVGAYEGESLGNTMSTLEAGSAMSQPAGNTGGSRVIAVSESLREAVSAIPLADYIGYRASSTQSSTIPGDCGGSATYTITVNDATGGFTGSFTFNSYCSGGETVSGSVSFSGTVNMGTYEFEQMTMSFNSLTYSSAAESFTVAGSMSLQMSGTTATATMNMKIKDNATSEVVWARNYVMTVTEGVDVNGYYVEVTISSGRFYLPAHGYVDVQTESPLRTYEAYEHPSSGALIVTGSGGTRARFEALSPTTYQVTADTDGDGFYDDWDSGVQTWS